MDLLSEIKTKPLPRHIAMVLDGNGRWASKRLLGRNLGHKKGAETLEKIVDFANQISIEHLTVFAFSTENWARSSKEVFGIMDLVRDYLKRYLDRISKLDDNIKIDVIGDRQKLDADIVEKILELEERTKDKSGLNFHIALNYGGRDDIVRAANKIAKTGAVFTEELLSSNLDTAQVLDPDLLIRTGGEHRISNFLNWQLAYTELYFSDVLWPDFTEKDFLEAICGFQSRNRRFGGR